MVNFHDYYSQDIYLAHHGIKGQKWGVRRFQNPDGTPTNLGKSRERANDKEHKVDKEKLKKFAKASLGVSLAVGVVLGPKIIRSCGNKIYKASIMKDIGIDFSNIGPEIVRKASKTKINKLKLASDFGESALITKSSSPDDKSLHDILTSIYWKYR